MKKEVGRLITALLAVLFGVFALIRFVPQVELIVSFLSLTFGLTALIWTGRAKASLSKGTDLHDYATYFMYALISIVLFLIWDILIFIFRWDAALIYPRYFLITIAFLIFVFAGYKMSYLGKQFGFKPQAKRMKRNKSKK